MILIHKAIIINEDKSFVGSLLVDGERIKEIYTSEVPENVINSCNKVIDATGLYLIPGIIDDHVHFREPGLTYKGDIASESRAAVAGGVTSFMDMPNNIPQIVTIDALKSKFEIAAEKSIANHSFYFGATNDNIKELLKIDKKKVCGVKVFMGSSTGNMLVDKEKVLQQIFGEVDMLIATHCEKEEIIRKNMVEFKAKYNDNIPIECHPLIRTEEACYQSSAQTIELADRYGARLHILHLSTAKELSLFSNAPIIEKKITAEACVHYLWFSDQDYKRLGAIIKWNPAIKTKEDREGLRNGVNSGKIDVIGTDHAPHSIEEKKGGSLATSGGPLIQHSLQVMLQLVNKGLYTRELIVKKMCHDPATLFNIVDRGFIRKGYYADLTLINPQKPYTVTKENILYKCGWSPFEGETFSHSIAKTFVNGNMVFDGERIVEGSRGKALIFNR